MSDYPQSLDEAFDRFYAAFRPYFPRWSSWTNVMQTCQAYGLDTPRKPLTIEELVTVAVWLRDELLPRRAARLAQWADAPHKRAMRLPDGTVVPREE